MFGNTILPVFGSSKYQEIWIFHPLPSVFKIPDIQVFTEGMALFAKFAYVVLKINTQLLLLGLNNLHLDC